MDASSLTVVWSVLGQKMEHGGNPVVMLRCEGCKIRANRPKFEKSWRATACRWIYDVARC